MPRACRIGFLVDGLLSRYQVRLLDAIRRAARKRHAVVVGFPGSYLNSVDSDHPTFDGSFVYELAGPTSVDGLIVASNLILSGSGAARIRGLCRRCSVPIVSIGPLKGVTTVDVDNRSGLTRVIEHLIVVHHCRRLAFIRGPAGNHDSLERELVFRAALESSSVDVLNHLLVTGNFLESSGAAAVRTLLDERHIPIGEIDGIVAANDQMATGAIQELAVRGLRVPEDLVVVGFDDDDHARSATPPLTTVAQPVYHLGEAAVACLIDKIEGRATPDSTILETFPVLRRSCGCRGASIAESRVAGDAMPTTHPTTDSPRLGAYFEHVREFGVHRLEILGADELAQVGIDRIRDYLTATTEESARAISVDIERLAFELASKGIDLLHWQDALSPLLTWTGSGSDSMSLEYIRLLVRGQNLHSLFSEWSAASTLKEQLRTVELANSLRVIGSAIVCARNFRALGRVLDAGLASLDVHYCCVCVFSAPDRSRGRVVASYHPAEPRPHGQIHSPEQLWRAVPPTLAPGDNAGVVDLQSFPAPALLPPNVSTPATGDFLVFPLMFGEEALGYVIFDVPINPQRSWLLEGLSGHLSSAIYEISRIEQLRQAREFAEEANSAKTAFVATMSHEVRTPLNAIMGNLDLCLRTELTKEQRKQLLRAQASSRALRSIVDDILDYSRAEAHRIDLESAPFDLDEVLQQVIGTSSAEANRKDLELVLDVDVNTPHLLVGDSLRLTQVLSNLVSNAVKFSSAGYVALRISRVDTGHTGIIQLQFRIEDTGIGMTPEQIGRIFKPFTQADSSVTRRYGGTGLGLTICQRLVELMGGEVFVQSEVGLGSTFEFAIPLQAEPGSEIQPSSIPSRIVLAVKNEAQMNALNRMLEDLGHEVVPVATGRAALDAVSDLQLRDSGRPCFLFADHKLSDMSATELSEALRRDGGNSHIKLVLLVPHDNDSLLAGDPQCIGGDSVLAKPPLSSNVERIVTGARSSYPCSGSSVADRTLSGPMLAGRRILVVQDSEMSRELACDLLRLSGAEPSAAADGAEAVQRTCAERFDLVLMDLDLPGLDGCMASRAIRERFDSTALPIVALSASSVPEDRIRCLDAGMNDFLRAPIGAAELIDTVQKWLTRDGDVPPQISSRPPASASFRLNAPSSPVLDVAKALGRLGGSRTLYRQLLKRFAENYTTGLEDLLTLLDAADCPKAASLVHVLVSAAGNIGASRLQHAAQSLEVALRQAHVAHILAARPRFEAEWHDAITAVQTTLERLVEGSQPPAVDGPAALGRDHVDQLRKLIDEHDTAAVELVDLLRDSLVTDSLTQLALQRLAQSVASYDFETAQQHLDSLSSQLKWNDDTTSDQEPTTS